MIRETKKNRKRNLVKTLTASKDRKIYKQRGVNRMFLPSKAI